jgi:hypothetical protein
MNLRLLALSGVVACAVALPLAVASAGQVGDGGRKVVRDLVRPSAEPSSGRRSVARASAEPSAVRPSAADDHKAPLADVGRAPLLLGLGLATAARCGPELISPDGIEAQTCVLSQGEETWARTYYRNATGHELTSELSLMGPDARTVQLRCAVGADDEPGMCETPRERTAGEPGAYTAVVEFAGAGEQGPLLLRSGSNSGATDGS